VIGLVDIVGDLIDDLDAEHYLFPEATGAQALKFLTKKHNH
jgi:HTH-type transcriptional regulator / antitoxin HigA